MKGRRGAEESGVPLRSLSLPTLYPGVVLVARFIEMVDLIAEFLAIGSG